MSLGYSNDEGFVNGNVRYLFHLAPPTKAFCTRWAKLGCRLGEPGCESLSRPWMLGYPTLFSLECITMPTPSISLRNTLDASLSLRHCTIDCRWNLALSQAEQQPRTVALAVSHSWAFDLLPRKTESSRFARACRVHAREFSCTLRNSTTIPRSSRNGPTSTNSYSSRIRLNLRRLQLYIVNHVTLHFTALWSPPRLHTVHYM